MYIIIMWADEGHAAPGYDASVGWVFNTVTRPSETHLEKIFAPNTNTYFIYTSGLDRTWSECEVDMLMITTPLLHRTCYFNLC